jgi:hypothetical protein
MSITKNVFVASSLLCGAAFLTKIALIAATGGADADSPMIGVLWALGLLTFLVSAATGAAYLLRTRAAWMRVLAGIAAVPVAFTVFNIVDALAKVVYRADGWFRDELGLVVIGVVTAAIGLTVMGGGTTRRSQQALTHEHSTPSGP